MFKYLFYPILFASLSVQSAINPETLNRINNAVVPQIGKRINSAIVGIFETGEIKYLSYGVATPNSMFEIGSITKTFTSLMFSLAIDKGLVTTETTLGDIRPEWKGQKTGSITLLELATHRSGLLRLPCNLISQDDSNPYKDYSEQELIASITDASIDSIPGCHLTAHPSELLAYSNWGIAILGYALSKRAGLTYQEVLRQWITGPLKMTDTVVEMDSDQKKRLIQGYTVKMVATGIWDRLSMFGNGAIKSTAIDMMIYAQAMLHPDQTPFADAIRRVQTRQYKNIAFNWYMTPAGSIWHNGMTGGYSSLMKVYLKKDFAVFDLTNTEADLNCLIETIEEDTCDPMVN